MINFAGLLLPDSQKHELFHVAASVANYKHANVSE